MKDHDISAAATLSAAAARLFWGAHAPLSTLMGAGLMIIATSRLAFAIGAAGALIWVYTLTALVLVFAKPILPKRGLLVLQLFLAAFWGSLYMLIFRCVNPYWEMETTFLTLLCPLSCIASGICRRIEGFARRGAILKAFLEALALGGVLLGLSLIREPLGFGSLTLPGGQEGLLVIFDLDSPDSAAYFPARIIAGASGGLLLLGYVLALFRRFRRRFSREETP
jgi:Na+-transporting NADH:ubiquinone oxidoreductase subunit NqrD